MAIFEKKTVSGNDVSYFGALPEKTVEISLIIPRKEQVQTVLLHLYGDGVKKTFEKTLIFAWKDLQGANDVYSVFLDAEELGIGIYYYRYEIASEKKTFYGKRTFDGELLPSDGDETIQLTIFRESKNVPKFMFGGTMYHIFVDRFCSSRQCKVKEGAILNPDWEHGIPQYPPYPGGYVENNMFFGGDLYGIVSKLDYLSSLGVTCLYLSPIFDAYSNHKYDTGDYMTVDSMFGGEEAFELLVKECRKREIHILLDGVFNHTGSDSLYFNQKGKYPSVGASQSENSPYYEWYSFRLYPDDYECWWNVKILPRVKSDCPSYRKYILGKDGVIQKWMKKGVDGFRLDVADELSDSFLKELNHSLKSINPNGMIYGEVWEDASNKIAYDQRKSYFLGEELDSVMNYPVREALICYLKEGNAERFRSTCETIYYHYPKSAVDTLMNILGTHDTERILTVLGGESGENCSFEELSTKKMTLEERKRGLKLLKMAFAINATLPGIPCIYYGDEAGMEGYRDPFNRLPYPWGNEERNLIDFYQKILRIRKESSVYQTGKVRFLVANENHLIFARYREKETYYTIVNRSNDSLRLCSNIPLKLAENGDDVSIVAPQSAIIAWAKKPIDDIFIEIKEKS